MDKKELTDIAVAELLDSRRNYENAAVMIETIIPLITEAIASEFDVKAERLEALAKKSGYALGANVERERLIVQDAARAVRKWRPTE